VKHPLSLFINNLSYYYRYEKVIFENLNVQAKFKNVLLIKGDVGSGKTTLLKLIYGFLKPFSGDIKLLKDQIEINPEKFYYLHANSTFNFVTGVIEDDFKLLGINYIKEYYKNKSVYELSGGELKKLAIEMGFLSGADVILMDEPFDMLDDEEIKKIKKLIERSLERFYFIIATHEDFLDDISDEIIYL